MVDKRKMKQKKGSEQISRRSFIKFTGTIAIGTGVGAMLRRVIWLEDAIAAIPASEGYLLVDTKLQGIG